MSRIVRHPDSEDSEDETTGDGNAHSGPGGLPVVEDEAEVHTGFRASFPLSFGKQESKARSLEAIHSNTKRSQVTSKKDKKNSAVGRKSSKWIDFEGSRFQAAADEEPVAPPPLIRNPKLVKDQDDGELIGPPLPRSTPVDDDGELTGPPLPSRGPVDDDGELIGPLLPGRAPVEDDEELIGPPLPSRMFVEDGEEDEDDDDDDGDDEDPDEIKVPISNEIVLKGPGKVVCAVAVDQTGSRVLTGSYDFTIHMYDFQGMNEQLRSFRQMEPSEGHQVRSLSWSPSADRFLAVTGSAQAKIYDRDGLTLGEFLKGDMYIRDLKNTKGHISGLTAGQWHPKEREKILTSSEDGSLRIWDVTDFKSQKQVIKPKLARPGRVSVSTCCWGMDGKCLAGGLTDGSVQIWNVKAGWGSRPDIYIEKAHEGSDDVTGLCFSADGRTVLSRSTDSTLKVWDLRQTKVALKVFDGLTNSFSQTSVSFSPDERLFLTGTSIEKGSQAGGLLVFFNKASLEVERKVGLSATQSVVCTSWHPRLNQIFASAGDRKGGATHVLYDPALSDRGALVCVSRAPRKKSAEDIVFRPIVHTPHSLPMFREDSSRKRQREKALLDPLKSKRPDLPVTGPGFGGRIGTTKGSLLTQYLMKEGGMIKEKWKQEDPREAILKHADAAAKEPSFFGPAYANTQPVTILEQSDDEEEEEAK